MDVQTSTYPLFQSIQADAIKDYLALTPSQIGAFSLSLDDQPEICLSLFNHSLLMKNRAKNFFVLELVFQVKLEILYDIQKDVTSQIIGFKFFTDKNKQQISFYSSDAPQFAEVLGKILNIKGFIEMFRPIRKLGRGNFATVYQVERRTDSAKFAVKAFSKQNSYCAKNGKQNLINQLALLRDLNVEPHPNVLKLEAVYESENSIYVVLELLEGKTLLQTLQERRGDPLTYAEIKIVMHGLLSGVEHLCKNRVMHRDLKPENVMIRKKSFQPVIVDFGLSTNVDLPEYLFFRCGTPGYVAPEIIVLTKSVHLEPTCDIFSLGVIFHILLTRNPLFSGIKYDEVYRANKAFQFNFEEQIYKRVDPKALDLMKKMLILSASERITSEKALQHSYFSQGQVQGQEACEEKKDCEVLTGCSTPIEKKKKKKFFFF